MIESLKDILEALGQRLRSPILGSFFLFVLILNWQPTFYLFFAETSVAVRLKFFNLNTDPYSLYVWPGILGLIFSLIVLPWAKSIGALAASRPVKWLKKLEGAAASEHRILQLKWAADEKAVADRIVIDQAKLVDEVKSEIVDEDLKIETEAKLRAGPTLETELTQLPSTAFDILDALAESQTGLLITIENENGGYAYYVDGGVTFGPASHRETIEVEAAIEALAMLELIEKQAHGASWKMTAKGYKVADGIESGEIKT